MNKNQTCACSKKCGPIGSVILAVSVLTVIPILVAVCVKKRKERLEA
ncbi:hypothetical protein [Bacillus sp. 1P06AnD]